VRFIKHLASEQDLTNTLLSHRLL